MKSRNWVILAASIYLSVLGLARVLYAKQLTSIVTPQAKLSATTQVSNEVVNTKLVAANTRLSFKLFSEILKKQSDENIFISPASVAIALDMLYDGSNGKTRQAIAQTLELQGMSSQEITQANSILKVTLNNADPKVQISIANSLWAREGEPFKPKFLQVIQNTYQAEVKAINFGAPTAPSLINTWVQQSTNGKINKIVDEIEPDIVFIQIGRAHV